MNTIMQSSWPAAVAPGCGQSRRKDRPKQLLPLLGEETLFQSTVARLADLFPPERILVVTVERQAAEMQRQVPEIPAQNYLIEPAPRGTASVVGLAAMVLCKRDPEAVMAVLPSDHFIRNRDLFHYLLREAFEVASENLSCHSWHCPDVSIVCLRLHPARRSAEQRVSSILFIGSAIYGKARREDRAGISAFQGPILEQRHVRLAS